MSKLNTQKWLMENDDFKKEFHALRISKCVYDDNEY